MKKILWALSVVLILLVVTGGYADTRIDKCNTYSDDLGISAAIDNYYGNICVWAGPIADELCNIYYCYKNRTTGASNGKGKKSQKRVKPLDQADTPYKYNLQK